MKHLWNIVLERRGLAAAYLLFGIALAFLESYSASYFQVVVDGFGAGDLRPGAIVFYAAVLVALCALSYLDEYPSEKLAQALYFDLKLQALRKLSVIDYLAYQGLGTGKLVQRIETGADAGKAILYDYYFQLARSLAPSILFSLFFIARLSRTILFAILAGYGLVFLITNLLLKALYRIKEQILSHEESLNRRLVRGFMELVVFRVNRRFGAELRKAQADEAVIMGAKVRMKLIHEAFFALFELMIILVKASILWYGLRSGSLSVGAAVALLTLVDKAYTPIAIFNVLFVQYKLNRAAFARYASFLDAPDDPRLTSGQALAGLRGGVAFREVSFSYGGRAVLSGLSLTLRPGEHVALAGPSGAGKSTLVKLLMGLIQPERGQVLVDGLDLAALNLSSYYGRVAYVPQESPVFDGTLRENLAFDEPVSDRALEEALTQAGLGPLLGKLERGLDTEVGERGVALSGGERQRLALARLFITDPQLVILDEATSALDARTEDLVTQNLLRRLTGKTLLVIAHRESAIRALPRVVVLGGGRVCADGGYGQLAAQGALPGAKA